MRELHGVISLELADLDQLKPHALLFDKFIYNPFGPLWGQPERGYERENVELGYLIEVGLVTILDMKLAIEALQVDIEKVAGKFETIVRSLDGKPALNDFVRTFSKDLVTRLVAAQISKSSEVPIIPMCKTVFPILGPTDRLLAPSTVMTIVLDNLPVPGQTASWQDILDFKAQAHGKLWTLRRFLGTLITKKHTEAEIRDNIEWSLNEYTNAMKLHKLKAGNSFVEVYVIPAIEVIENLAKFNLSKIAKGALSVKMRQVELMEAEMKAPGREVAYICDAQKRFGGRNG